MDEAEYGFDIYGDEDFGELEDFGDFGDNDNETMGEDFEATLDYEVNTKKSSKSSGNDMMAFYLIIGLFIINICLLSTFILKKKEKSLKAHYVTLLTKTYCQLLYTIIISIVAYILCKNMDFCNLSWILFICPLYSLSSICLSLLGFLP